MSTKQMATKHAERSMEMSIRSTTCPTESSDTSRPFLEDESSARAKVPAAISAYGPIESHQVNNHTNHIHTHTHTCTHIHIHTY
jgi:hypothetical protein